MTDKNKNTWCPQIKASCRGLECVCCELRSRVESSNTPSGVKYAKMPFCHLYTIYLPREVVTQKVDWNPGPKVNP